MAEHDARLGARIGPLVRRRREQRGLTAAELARRSGISKASLSSIEAGRGNPTIDTLYALAFTLRIPVSDLLEEQLTGPELRRGAPGLADEISRELLTRIGPGHSTEVWRFRMPPRSEVLGVPHSAGTIEHLLVASGEVVAGPDDDRSRLGAGDLLSFRGDGPHSYLTDEAAADITVMLTAPR